MRRLVLLLALVLGLFSTRFASDCHAQPQVTLGWNAETNPFVAGYYLAWGTNSGNLSFTNTYHSRNCTNGTISNLVYGVNYYVAVAAFATNGYTNPTGPFTSTITYLTNAPVVFIPPIAPSDGPPPPPLPFPPGVGRPVGLRSSDPGQNTSGSSPATGLAHALAPSSAPPSTNITQAQMWGIPPYLILTSSNKQLNMTIEGTMGATFALQCSTNLSTWFTITNVTMTNVAPIETNAVPGQAQDAIDLAFVPSLQTFPLPPSATQFRGAHFRVLMSNDYPILASRVLTNQGYSTRLVLVDMPGGIVDDCCYISQAGAFIHYSTIGAILQLEGSGSTIRQIAATMANNRNMDWTTASEFTYSNGYAAILATVVESDSPSTDPVAGTNSASSIVIDF